MPKEIGNLTNLTFLYLAWNKLITLPKEIGKLTNLTEIDITWDELETIPIEILDLNCFSGDDYANIGIIFSNNKEYENAYQTMKVATEKKPKNSFNYSNLSWFSLFVNKPEEAIIAAKKSLELEPEETVAYTNLALAYVLNNEFEKAKPREAKEFYGTL